MIMGNLSFMIPTQNEQDYNRVAVNSLLLDHFKDQFVIEATEEHDSIQIRFNGIIVVDMYFNQECYILEFDRDINDLKQQGEICQVNLLNKLRELNPDLEKTLEYTHGEGIYKERKKIEIFLHNHFKAYIFDEGIHPEFIGPDYVWSKS